MGTCCSAHLATKIREYAPDAQNGAVTVQVQRTQKCDYCKAPGEFTVSYFRKNTNTETW